MEREPVVDTPPSVAQSSLSYKFQRLREKLREAIAVGDLAGKLPGERALAKRFHVNAKTLSKALTDLAAEGLLDRSIGRGTFVKGCAPAAITGKRWLMICEPDQACWEIVEMIRKFHPELEILTDVSSVRPSFLNQFSSVISMAGSVPEAFIRDLVVRNMPVVVVGREPRTYSTHAVVFDGPLAVSQAARDLMLGGHLRFAAVEPRQCTVVVDTLRQASKRYSPSATVDMCDVIDVSSMVEQGVTAFVCHSVELGGQVKAELLKNGIQVPQRASVIAIGSSPDNEPVSGYFLPRVDKANAIVEMLQQPNLRPTTLWLAGTFVDRGTTATISARPDGIDSTGYHTAAI